MTNNVPPPTMLFVVQARLQYSKLIGADKEYTCVRVMEESRREVWLQGVESVAVLHTLLVLDVPYFEFL